MPVGTPFASRATRPPINTVPLNIYPRSDRLIASDKMNVAGPLTDLLSVCRSVPALQLSLSFAEHEGGLVTLSFRIQPFGLLLEFSDLSMAEDWSFGATPM